MSADDDSLRRVDISWPPDKIRDFCEREDNWVLELDETMSAPALEALYWRQLTSESPYLGLVAEIVSHANTPQNVLDDCFLRFASSVEVMANLALSANVSDDKLVALSRHQHDVVREHAAQSLHRRSGT